MQVEPPPTVLEPMTISNHVEVRLYEAFKIALPHLSDPRNLSLSEGINGMTCHFDRYKRDSSPITKPSNVITMEKYLDLMKSVFMLNLIKSSREYDVKVNQAGNLLWADYLYNLEEVGSIPKGCSSFS